MTLRLPHTIRLGLVLGGFFVIACEAQAARPWLKIETDQAILLTDAKEKEVHQAMLELARIDQLAATVPFVKGTSANKPIFMMLNSGSQYRKLVKDSPRAATDYFLGSLAHHTLAVTYDRGLDSHRREIFASCYIWHLMRDSRGQVPTWMDSGFKSIFGGLVLERHKVIAGRIDEMDGYRYFLTKGNLWSWDKLSEFQTDKTSLTAPRYEQISYYANSWIFSHFLLLGENRPEPSQLKKFASLARLGKPMAEILPECLGLSLEEADAEIARYIKTDEIDGISQPDSATLESIHFTVSPLAELEKQLIDAEIQFTLKRFAEASAICAQLITATPENPAIWETVAAMHLANNDVTPFLNAESIARLRGSTNTALHIRANEQRVYHAGPETDPEMIAKFAQDALIALDELGGNYRCWATLAYCLSCGMETSPPIEQALRDAMEFRPEDQYLKAGLILSLIDSGHTEEATRLFDEVLGQYENTNRFARQLLRIAGEALDRPTPAEDAKDSS